MLCVVLSGMIFNSHMELICKLSYVACPVPYSRDIECSRSDLRVLARRRSLDTFKLGRMPSPDLSHCFCSPQPTMKPRVNNPRGLSPLYPVNNGCIRPLVGIYGGHRLLPSLSLHLPIRRHFNLQTIRQTTDISITRQSEQPECRE